MPRQITGKFLRNLWGIPAKHVLYSRWELGLYPYSHGMRLRMGLAGRPRR